MGAELLQSLFDAVGSWQMALLVNLALILTVVTVVQKTQRKLLVSRGFCVSIFFDHFTTSCR